MTIVATPALRAPEPTPVTKAGEDSLVSALIAALLAPLAVLGHSLADLLHRGDPDPSGAVDWSLMRRRLLRALRGPLGTEAAQGARRVAGDVTTSFDLVPHRAVTAAETHAAQLVTGISDDAREAVRQIIARSQREGRTVNETEADVRQVIGLSPRWANAIANHRRHLQEQKTPPSPARIDQLVAAYRDRLLSLQARTIARTELLRASNLGAMEGYRQAVAAGAFPDGVVREWVTAHDSRLCPICRPLSGQVAEGLDAEFETSLGPVLTPPAHPGCRCRMITREPSPTRRAS